MSIRVNLQIASMQQPLPAAEQIQQWAQLALSHYDNTYELNIRIIDASEMRHLNASYRHKDKTTNVLSFPALTEAEPYPQTAKIIGDIALCAPVICQEAQQQKKRLEAHWAHLVIHGCLHCIGYDHATAVEANEMENLEIRLLATLGYSNPYGVITDNE